MPVNGTCRRRLSAAGVGVVLCVTGALPVLAGEERGAPAAGVAPADPFLNENIGLIARDVTAWREGGTWCYMLVGEATATQGDRTMVADSMVVWFDAVKARAQGTAAVEIYSTGNVLMRLIDVVLQRDEAFVIWRTAGQFDVEARRERRILRRAGEDLFLHAQAARERALAEAAEAEQEERLRPPGERARPVLQVFPTSKKFFKLRSLPPKAGTTERTTVITGGVDVVYKDLEEEAEIEIAADHIVMWSQETPPDGGDTPDRRNEIEVYAEGNVAIFALGGTLRAPRVYYNLTTGQALLVQGRVETYSEARKVPVIYEAERVRQFGRGVMTAQNAIVTTSDFGVPHNYIFARRVSLTEHPVTDASGQPRLDEEGRPLKRQVATTWYNTYRILGIPVFYWPYAEHDLDRPETGIRHVRLRQDSDYGIQVLTESDLGFFLTPLIGEPDPATDLTLNVDFMSERGLAAGVDAEYGQETYLGYVRSYFLHDEGEDDGGFDPPTRDRGRLLWRHRHDILDDTYVNLEFSWISDEAFLNEYFEKEFREGKDQETLAYLKHQRELWAATLLVKERVNDFQSETDYLPRLAFHALGVPLFEDTVTLISSSEMGYVRLRHGDPEREDLAPIPESQEAGIFRVETRDELYRPFALWIFQVAPFVQGRLGYFGKRAGREMLVPVVLADGTTVFVTERGSLRSGSLRVGAAAGVRLSTQFWRVYEAQSQFWNIDRLRHLVTPQITYFDLFALNVDRDELVQFDAIDDVDKMRALELKLRQRLQTRRGVGEDRRVVDWVTFDVSTNVYPSASRDNDGDVLDDIVTDLEWRVTDVVSIVNEARFDLADRELGTFSIGVGVDQTPRYSFFIGQRYINESDSSATTMNLAYQLNEKWRIDLFTQYDWGEEELLQARVQLHRDLYNFVLRFGVLEDGSRDDTRIFVELVPKGLPELRVQFR